MKYTKHLLCATTAAFVLFAGFQALSSAQEGQPTATTSNGGLTNGFMKPKKVQLHVAWGDAEKTRLEMDILMDDRGSGKSRTSPPNSVYYSSYFSYLASARPTVNPDDSISVDLDTAIFYCSEGNEKVVNECSSSITLRPGVETVIRKEPRIAVTASVVSE